VRDVGPLLLPAGGQVGREVVHEREQAVDRVGDGARRARRDVVDPDARREPDAALDGRVVAASVDDDVVAPAAELLRECGDVDVLPAGLDAADRGERAGVLGDHRDPHPATSS
jgi:hypothetical protein